MFKDNSKLYLVAFLVMLCAFVYGVSSILLPFVLGFVLSYFLVPIVDSFCQVKIPRSVASIVTIALFIGFLGVISITIFPVLYSELLILGDAISKHKEDIIKFGSSFVTWINGFDPQIALKIQEGLADFYGIFLSFASSMIAGIASSSFAALTTIALIFITPIVMFYVLNNWNSIVRVNSEIVPKRYKKDAAALITQINGTLSGYIKGQTYVCFILATFYSVALSIAGLQSAIALGVMSGLLVFIPYAGVLFSGLLCVLIAITQSGEISYALIILGIFISGQLLEGNFLSPLLIGRSVGLNPIWIIFGVMAGGALLGFVGVLIALPLTAVLGVVIRFAFGKYKKSKYYNYSTR